MTNSFDEIDIIGRALVAQIKLAHDLKKRVDELETENEALKFDARDMALILSNQITGRRCPGCGDALAIFGAHGGMCVVQRHLSKSL